MSDEMPEEIWGCDWSEGSMQSSVRRCGDKQSIWHTKYLRADTVITKAQNSDCITAVQKHYEEKNGSAVPEVDVEGLIKMLWLELNKFQYLVGGGKRAKQEMHLSVK